MNKKQIWEVIQSAILYLDGAEPTEYGLGLQYVAMGKKMVDYLRNFEFTQTTQEASQ